jgi:hypothetical protein
MVGKSQQKGDQIVELATSEQTAYVMLIVKGRTRQSLE